MNIQSTTEISIGSFHQMKISIFKLKRASMGGVFIDSLSCCVVSNIHGNMLNYKSTPDLTQISIFILTSSS